jgi:type IV secretion system protein VirB9
MMSLRKCLLMGAVLSAMLNHWANAEQIPLGGYDDSRMRVVPYNSNQVVHLSTVVGGILVISFAPTETVTAVAETDSTHLSADPKQNYLFLKPSAALPMQSLIVLTQLADGSLRRYVFEIQTVNAQTMADNTPGVYFSVQFTYPEDEEAAAAAAAAAEAAKTAQLNAAALKKANQTAATAILDAQRTNPFVGRRNYNYDARGDKSLAPTTVWDNGYSTVMQFPGNVRIPSVFVIDPDGKEATTTPSISGSTVEIGLTSKEFVLRDGSTVLDIFNRGYNTVGNNPGTGTTSSQVLRVITSNQDAIP